MSEEKKTVELRDEELEKVSGGGGYDFAVVVHKGDVYVNKLQVDNVIVITSSINGGVEQIPYISIRKEADGTWWQVDSPKLMPCDLFINNYQYSAELTTQSSGKIHFL